MSIENTLRRAEVFLGLTDSEISLIATLPSSRQESYQSGHVLFSAGSEAEYVYLVEEGQIHIMVEIPSPGNKPALVSVDVFNKGSLLGWSALVRPHIYILSAVCQKPSKVAMMSGRELLSLFEQNQNIGYKVFEGLSQVIGTSYRDLQQILIRGKRWPFIEKHSGT